MTNCVRVIQIHQIAQIETYCLFTVISRVLERFEPSTIRLLAGCITHKTRLSKILIRTTKKQKKHNYSRTIKNPRSSRKLQIKMCFSVTMGPETKEKVLK